MSLSFREEYLVDQLDRLLAPSTLDGTEGHSALEQLAIAVRDADGDPVRIATALRIAKQFLRDLMAESVPRQAVNDAVCTLPIVEPYMAAPTQTAAAVTDDIKPVDARICELLAQLEDLQIQHSWTQRELYQAELELKSLQNWRSELTASSADTAA
jgi:hypothetical protein